MISLGVLSITMIIAACLLILTQNNRLSSLLHYLRELKSHHIKSNHKIKTIFFKRIRLLQVAILCEYASVAFFSLAAFFIILSTIASSLMYIIVILLITGCFMTFLGVISAIIEVSYATTLFSDEEDIFLKGSES